MAKDKTPDAWIASFSESGGTITFPLASVTGLTSGDCNTTTGDIREVVMKLMNTLKTHQDSLAAADSLSTFSINKSVSPTEIVFSVRLAAAPATFTISSEPA